MSVSAVQVKNTINRMIVITMSSLDAAIVVLLLIYYSAGLSCYTSVTLQVGCVILTTQSKAKCRKFAILIYCIHKILRQYTSMRKNFTEVLNFHRFIWPFYLQCLVKSIMMGISSYCDSDPGHSSPYHVIWVGFIVQELFWIKTWMSLPLTRRFC